MKGNEMNAMNAFQNEVFSDGHCERFPKPEADTGAAFAGEVKIRGKMFAFKLVPHAKDGRERKSDFMIALYLPSSKIWASFGWARFRKDRSGTDYLEFCLQNADYVPGVFWFKAWPDEDTAKGETPNFYPIRRSQGITRGGVSPDFGGDSGDF